MKVCVVGAGAIGGLLGARLARAGHEVSLIARGAHLAAIRARGLKVIGRNEEIVATDAIATDDAGELGAHEVVLMALKSHQIAAVIDHLPNLLGDDGVMVTLQNGVPWWYFQNLPPGAARAFAGRAVESVDPGGVLAGVIDPSRILGCVAYPAAAISAPGVITHLEGMRFPIGELDGTVSARAERVSAMLIEGGFKSPVLDDIRAEIWLKLWGNLCFNPISALTHATLEAICRFPLSRELAATLMREAQAIAAKLGITFRVSVERRIEGAEKVGAHKTSMLQDVEAGKPLEIDGMLGAVIELADLTDTEVPALRALYACAGLLNNTLINERIAIKGASLE
ncbi:MAG: 2-dehydropantoate 2-reductase [bacterium]